MQTAWLRRFRPYIALVGAVALLLTVVVASGEDKPADQVARTGVEAAAPSGGIGGAAVGITPDVAGGQVGGTAVANAGPTAPGTPVASARPTAPGTPATKAGPTAPGTALAKAGRYPGVGTPEALANPNCDPATGRIRFPDPYAPPCVAPWPAGADNGGSTSPGVDAKKIKMVVYAAASAAGFSTEEQKENSIRAAREVFDIFNKHYELWGRQVELIRVEGSGSDEVAQRADAVRIANEIKPFLTTTVSYTAETYSVEAAARGIIVMNTAATWKVTQQQAPYRWSNFQDDRATIMHTTEYVGKRLAGRPARWAGDVAVTSKPRAFGLIHPTTWDRATFDAAAASQGVRLADALAYEEGEVGTAQERARIVVARFKGKGVTSVIDGADFIFNIVLTKEATNQLFFPEWIVTGWNLQDIVLFSRLYDPQQWRNAFGFGPLPPLSPADKTSPQANYTWHYGRPPPSSDAATIGALNTIAFMTFTGLHLAGPNLTPQTYRDAMFSFPPTGGVWCGCRATFGLSFGRNLESLPWDDYTGWDDVTEKWWDPDHPTKDEIGLDGVGAYMKVDGGRRYAPGGWPRGEPKAFDPEGAVEGFTDYPPAERPPSYEHKPHPA